MDAGGTDKSLDAMLESAGLEPVAVKRAVKAALEEDLLYGPDATTEATVSARAKTVADVVARKDGVVAGLPVAAAVLTAVGIPFKAIEFKRQDGEKVVKGDVLLTVRAGQRKVLTAERTLLNFMTHLSGIATHTRQWADAISGTGCAVRDTRKTTPGLRVLEKYAVRCGGGQNHRMGLGDAILIKDNHVLAAGNITAAIKAAQAARPELPMEVECDTLDQVKEALAMDVKLILLDNMNIEQIKKAVAMGKAFPGTRFESSGGLRLETARRVAATGVDYMAVGGLTHSSPALDIALDIRQ